MIETLSHSDLEKLKRTPHVYRLQFLIFLIIALPVSLVIAFLMVNTFRYVYTVLIILGFQLLPFSLYTLYNYLLFRKDLIKQEKIVGNAKVVKKLTTPRKRILTDNQNLKSLNIDLQNVFENIKVGDLLTIEQTQHSKFLLKLEKNGRDLITSG